ncbi:E3 ubiquitin-protein ligase RNF8-like isoform X2 [Leguminivora glycinivorella]|uniref:E3 ubiquitin-protein ligase RNF8-like isoform X2 n=1 Tax=Leguminivora glycinivorella TaxID=1035111 RepID=UPI00200F782D|nr:E3 ubiquitin-protein ligase RNF8-like isoform X2 [Leguminivora glycinivorella]
MEDHFPILCASKPLKPEFVKFQRIAITSEDFKLGRGLQNSVVIPFVCLSRDHCVFKKIDNNWILEDCSSFGIEVNGDKLGKGQKRKLNNQDVIKLESSNEFVYKFVSSIEQSTPCKRRKLETDENCDFINNVKKKFEESQSCEIQHIEEKIQNAKHMQSTSKMLKEQLQLDLSRKEQQLHDEYAAQIKKLKGQQDEVEQQKALLLEERDLQLAAVKVEMEGKIASLMEQISKHNETESELIQENNALKEKLLKERDEFLSELNRESSSKQEMLDKLEARIREQEEVRLKEKKELEETLRRETEQFRLAKEKELKELEEQKLLREKELEEQLNSIKSNLAKQIELHENEKREAEQLLNQQKEQLQKLTDEEKSKIKQLIEERAEIEKKLALAEADAGKSIQTLEEHVKKREIELSALAADRIQQQAEQSSEVISSLQAQLEKVRDQLQSVETEKKSLLESLTVTCVGEGSKSADVEDIIETELQCSICSELFIHAITLGCSHSFCKYCIDKWKKNKRECPICRTVITSECKSIVLDSLIERMMQTSEEAKQKRQEILNARAELAAKEATTSYAGTSRGGHSDDDSSTGSESDNVGEESWPEENDYENYDDEYDWGPADDYEHPLDVFFGRGGRYFSDYRGRYTSSSDSDSGSDVDPDAAAADAGAARRAPAAGGAARAAGGGAGAAGGHPAGGAAGVLPAPSDAAAAAGHSGGQDGERAAGASGRRRRRYVPGLPGSYYGGYGRCYRCRARGHWAPGCPDR